MAILTYFMLSLSGELHAKTLALLLIFSGGSFLHVAACHILPSLSLQRHEVAGVVIGILLPILPGMMQMEHGH